MAFFKTSLDPVGNVVSVPGLDALVAAMKQAWADLKAQIGKVDWSVVINFLTKCVDDLVVYLVQHDIPGPDKKATVIDAIDKVYDTVIVGVLPWYLRPFGGWIKTFVINQLVSAAIDYIVSKYQSGSWAPQATTNVLKTWGASLN